MSLIDSIDNALTAATAQQAEPFRLDLSEDEIELLKSAALLDDAVGPKTISPGAYKGVNVFPTTGKSMLLAQPKTALRALSFPLTS
jgi:hypothetical protein